MLILSPRHRTRDSLFGRILRPAESLWFMGKERETGETRSRRNYFFKKHCKLVVRRERRSRSKQSTEFLETSNGIITSAAASEKQAMANGIIKLNSLAELGFMPAPVCTSDRLGWSGFKLERYFSSVDIPLAEKFYPSHVIGIALGVFKSFSKRLTSRKCPKWLTPKVVSKPSLV